MLAIAIIAVVLMYQTKTYANIKDLKTKVQNHKIYSLAQFLTL